MPVPYAAWVPTTSKTPTARIPVSDATRSAMKVCLSLSESTSGGGVNARGGPAIGPPEPMRHPRERVAELASISSSVPNFLQSRSNNSNQARWVEYTHPSETAT